MVEKEKKVGDTEARKARLAFEMKANLRRRKAQARARRDEDDAESAGVPNPAGGRDVDGNGA